MDPVSETSGEPPVPFAAMPFIILERKSLRGVKATKYRDDLCAWSCIVAPTNEPAILFDIPDLFVPMVAIEPPAILMPSLDFIFFPLASSSEIDLMENGPSMDILNNNAVGRGLVNVTTCVQTSDGRDPTANKRGACDVKLTP
jgi:hypothetical protein